MASAATGDSPTSSVASASPDARRTEDTKAVREEPAKVSRILADVTAQGADERINDFLSALEHLWCRHDERE
jgi:hypothetical protein